MLKSGIKVGIGVDGGASNDSGICLAELRLTVLVHRIQGIHGNLSPEEWLGPKKCLGWLLLKEVPCWVAMILAASRLEKRRT